LRPSPQNDITTQSPCGRGRRGGVTNRVIYHPRLSHQGRGEQWTMPISVFGVDCNSDTAEVIFPIRTTVAFR
ncbi:MAG TPA: hypothetical protein VLK23_10930, partial [Thermodesulfobacteriota bacterium]|nr:hypothetical protein [Thermodesulfobacteriota bacterium]